MTTETDVFALNDGVDLHIVRKIINGYLDELNKLGTITDIKVEADPNDPTMIWVTIPQPPMIHLKVVLPPGTSLDL
ncbi:hypothetical protein [Methylobacterium indicum]|uniref:Uncharacterized protein n=1 Tax=Methylobacterium indicum TaxID=1775910 RepID=A0A8H9CAS7_9HYPH|nr:hypothetical protein [Methylobacterium indicum]BCM87755.1 hypothetical protein mvi_62160 [Methylobacterium indicum]